MAKNTFFSRS